MSQDDSKQQDKIRVTYWHGRGKAEAIRMVIAACGLEFEETWLSKPSEWSELGKSGVLNYQQIPLITINDTFHLTQSQSTSRYIGRKYGLYDNNLSIESQYTIDHVQDSCFDFHNAIGGWPFGVKNEMKAKGKDFKLDQFADNFIMTVEYIWYIHSV